MINDYYTTTYSVYTNSGSIDANGDYSETGSLSLTGKCKLTPVSGQNYIHATDKGEVTADFRIYMPVVNIDEEDNIVINDSLYQILFIANRLNHHLEIDVVNIGVW